MNDASSTDHGGDQRLYECLAEYLEAQGADQPTAPAQLFANEPEIAAGLNDYLAAVDAFRKFCEPLQNPSLACRPQPLPITLGDYELLERIGLGGNAVVYRARQKTLSRTVAVKMAREDRLTNPADLQRLQFEAEAVAHLEHPGIVPIYEIGDFGGWPFFSMKFYEGGNLSSRLKDSPRTPRQAADLVESIAHAVHYAHQRGILHRDLKPSNILLDSEGRPHVADFGLAKRLRSDQEQSGTGELLGTPAYIAPERIAGNARSSPATIATDVYGLGAILYVLITGQPPFSEPTTLETLLAVRDQEPPRPSQLNPRIDRDLETICLKCLEKDPAQRYPSAIALADDLRRWRYGEPIAARQTGPLERLKRWSRRNPALAAGLLAGQTLVILAVVGLITGYILVRRANNVAEQQRTIAEQNSAELETRLYASQMSLAYRRMERGELDDVRTLLDEFQSREDIRGFEWRWFDRQARRKPRSLVRLLGHENNIYGGEFAPDGRTIATCGADGTVRLWNAQTGDLEETFDTGAGLSPRNEKYDEDALQFIPNGNLLASTCENGAVRLWTLADGSQIELRPAPTEETLAVDVSADGKFLATASCDSIARIWNVAERRLEREFRGHKANVQGIAFSPNGREVASTDAAGALFVWNRETGEPRLSLAAGVNTHCIDYSPDGHYLATEGGDSELILWDAVTGERAAILPASPGVRSIDFSPNGCVVACAANDGCVRIWSIPDGRPLHLFRAHSEIIWNLRFSDDGRRLLTCSSDRTCVVWEIEPEKLPLLQMTQPVRQLTFSPDSQRLAVITGDSQLQLIDPAGVDPPQAAPQQAVLLAPPAFSAASDELAFVAIDGAIHRWRFVEGRSLAPFQPSQDPAVPLDRRATRLAYLPDGRLTAIASNGLLYVCEHEHWQEFRPEEDSDYFPRFLAPVEHGNVLAICSGETDRLQIWDLKSQRRRHQIQCENSLEVADISPNEGWLAYGQQGATIGLMELRLPGSRKALVGHRGAVTDVDFSPDGLTLVSAGDDGATRLWNVATGTEMFVLEQRRQRIDAVEFSPDGRWLAIGGRANVTGQTLSLHQTSPAH